jgi:hypothetical protein
MLLRALKSALSRLFSLKRLWLLYYLLGLLFAAAVAIPARSIISPFAGKTLTAGSLSGRMDMTFLIELLHYRAAALQPLFILALILAASFWLLLLFLSGGALKLMAGDHPYRPREFWDACGRYFGRFFRFFLCTLPLAALLLFLPALFDLIQRLFWGKDPGQNITVWTGFFKTAGRYTGLLLWALIFDYGRIMIVLKNEKKTHRSLLPALRFTGRHFIPVFALALLLAGSGFLALLIYNFIADQLHAPAGAIIAALFCWQQLYMFFRSGLRLFGLASQMKLYQRLVQP